MIGLSKRRGPASSEGGTRKAEGGGWSSYFSTLLLTLANPMTIVAFAGIFAGFSGAADSGYPLLLVAGVFLGSALWWLALSSLVGAFRNRLSSKWLKAINVGSGMLLLVLGASVLWSAYAGADW